MKKLLLLKSLLLLCALIVGSTSVWAEPITLFHESFGDNSGSARDWSDSYSVKSGVASVYSGITGYTVSNVKQGKNTTGSTKSGLNQSSAGTDAYIIIGPLSVANYNTLKLTYQWKAGSTKGTYSTHAYYATSAQAANGTWTEVSGSGTGATTFVERSYNLPEAAQVSTLYLKIVWNTSNTQAIIDEVDLAGTESGGGGSSDPSISLGSSSIEAPEAGKDGTINVTYNNLTNYDADVIFYESDGTTYASYDHSWLTAEINASTKNLDYSITANTGAARTAYLKIYAIGDEGDVESSLITVTQAAKTYPVVTTLDLTDAGWGFPSEYETSEKSYTNDGYTITLGEAGTGHKKYVVSENIVSLIFGKKDATLTLPAFGFNVSKFKVYGQSGASKDVTFNVFVGDDAVSTEVTSSKVDHEFVIAANKQAVGTIYTIKVTNSNNCQISKIEVFGNGCEAGLVQSYGWATYIPTVDVEYPANTAYIVTDASVSSGLTLEEVTEVPAGTPILLKGAGAKTAIALDAAPSAPSSNLLEVSDGSALPSVFYPYVLAKNGESACFKQWTGDMSDLDGRVMLVLDEEAAARGIFELDGDVTAISTTLNDKGEMTNDSYFNLAGQRVAQPTKGLYIVNGKKVIVK